jgi:hypothetical protein
MAVGCAKREKKGSGRSGPFSSFLPPFLPDALAARRHVLRWDPSTAVAKVEHLCVVTRGAAE